MVSTNFPAIPRRKTQDNAKDLPVKGVALAEEKSSKYLGFSLACHGMTVLTE